MAIPGKEGRLQFIALLDPHQVLSFVDVQLYENIDRAESFKQIIKKQ